MAGKCIWIQRGTNAGDVHISESGYRELQAGTATCGNCGTEVGKLVGGQWYERVRSRRGGDRYTPASSAFLEQLGREAAERDHGVVEKKVRA